VHYFKRNIGDYHKKAGRLSMLEHGAYTLLLDACYDREEFPTMEEALDWCWARSDDEEAAVRFVLNKFFHPGRRALCPESRARRDRGVPRNGCQEQRDRRKAGSHQKNEA